METSSGPGSSTRPAAVAGWWLSNSGLSIARKKIDRAFTADKALSATLSSSFRNDVEKWAASTTDWSTRSTMHALLSFARKKGCERQARYAIHVLASKGDPGALTALHMRLSDRITRCDSAKFHALNMCILAACSIDSEMSGDLFREHTCPAFTAVRSLDTDAEVQAWSSFNVMVQNFMDEFKHEAFNTAFLQPARFFFHCRDDSLGFDHVDVHGVNSYLTLLENAGFALPLTPDRYDDDWWKGAADFWEGLPDSVWQQFADENNFGKQMEGIKGLKRLKQRPKTTHKIIKAPSEMKHNPKADAVYLEKFCHLFRREFFVRRCFETLNAENSPEYVGFRKALNVLFPLYARQFELGDNLGFLEFLYDEELIELQQDNCAHLLAWLGVLEPRFLKELQPKRECPLCFEMMECKEVSQFDHWEAHGDVSGHRACNNCKEQWKSNSCPFCKQLCLRDELIELINTFSSSVATYDSRDHNASAALLEGLQLLGK